MRVAVIDPYPQGADSVTLTYQNSGAGTVTPASGQLLTPVATFSEAAGTFVDFTINRPSGNQPTGRVTFTATATNRIPDSDAVDITPQVLLYTECAARVISATATQLTVQVDAVSAFGAPTVELIGIVGTATRASGPLNSVASPSGTQWVFNRGAFGTGVSQARFRTVLSGYQSDFDVIDLPEVGRDTISLVSRARVTATSASTVTVRFAVLDPIPQGVDSVTVAWQSIGTTTVLPVSGGTITPAATFTEAAGTYIDYTVTRPPFGTGTARATFTATAANRTADSDSVDVPAVESDTATPDLQLTPLTSTASQLTFNAFAVDPRTAGFISATFSFLGCSGTVNGVAVADGASTSVVLLGQPPGTVTMRATTPSGGGAQISRTISERTLDFTPPDFAPNFNLSTTTGTASWATPAVGVTVFARTDGGAYAAQGGLSYIVSRNAVGGATKRIYVKATNVAGVDSTTYQYEVPAQEDLVGPATIDSFSVGFDYVNDYLEYNFTISNLGSGYVEARALLNGVDTGFLVNFSSSATQIVNVAPVAITGAGTWTMWIQIINGASVVARSMDIVTTT